MNETSSGRCYYGENISIVNREKEKLILTIRVSGSVEDVYTFQSRFLHPNSFQPYFFSRSPPGHRKQFRNSNSSRTNESQFYIVLFHSQLHIKRASQIGDFL